MKNLHVILPNKPGELARFGQLLGTHGIGLEGGGVFTVNDQSHANFLVEEGEKARDLLVQHGFDVKEVSTPMIRKLKQEQPGELGAIAQSLAACGVNIITQYSDHNNRLILVTDNDKLAQQATIEWAV